MVQQTLRSPWNRLREISSFGLIGLLNTAINFGILNALILLMHKQQGFWLIIFNGCAFMGGVVNSYLLNTNFTFRTQRRGSLWDIRLFARFFGAALSGLLVNTAVIWLTLPLLAHMGNAGVVNRPLLAINISKAIATLISLCWNYGVMKRWVYSNRGRKKHEGLLA